MSAVETTATQNLRVKMTKQLAEVLLRKICSADYKLPGGLIDTTGLYENHIILNNYEILDLNIAIISYY